VRDALSFAEPVERPARIARKGTNVERGALTRRPDIFPESRYAGAAKAVAFLERAFGFRRALVVPDGDGGIAHAELGIGHDVFMLAGARADRWTYRTPLELDGAVTGANYIAVSDIDALYRRVEAASAAIVRELGDTDYGSREFSARDPEGFLWHFGTYHPNGDAAGAFEPELFAGMRYRRAHSAIAWLVDAFGFQVHLVVPGDGDDVAHAQLTFGDSTLMLGSLRDDPFNMKTPADLGGAYTQSLHAFVTDPDAHHARAKAAGAEILAEPAEGPHGSRGYVARDPEGYVWTFGTYRPSAPAPGARS
jgi:uncharacterized glyoxalase superfamily protein PhnB